MIDLEQMNFHIRIAQHREAQDGVYTEAEYAAFGLAANAILNAYLSKPEAVELPYVLELLRNASLELL